MSPLASQVNQNTSKEREFRANSISEDDTADRFMPDRVTNDDL